MESDTDLTFLNNDELFLLAIQLDLPDLINFCKTNRKTRKLCNTNRIWNYKLEKEFPNYIEDFPKFSEFSKSSSRYKYNLLHGLKIVKEWIASEANYTMSLKHLYYKDNLDLVGMRLEIIPKEIGFLTNLKLLDMSSNRIKNIPKEIGFLTNLRLLDMSSNRIKSIPKEIVLLSNLSTLNLQYNKIKIIPPEIGMLHNLKNLFLGVNNIKTLPDEFFNLENLEFLVLTENEIEHISNKITQLKNLKSFRYSGNKIKLSEEIITFFFSHNVFLG